MTAYYNENDPGAAAWLRELIRDGLIAPGFVDERDIRDVAAADLVGYRQCHFFAGVGTWSHALRCAGWADDRRCWTGSCPCQPFSAAGRRAGVADERHLWPAWFYLIGQCRPGVILGEQVASGDAKPWLDLVHSDMEALGYAFGAVVFPAAGVGAPHIRHRIWFVADSQGGNQQRVRERGEGAGRAELPAGGHGPTGVVADSAGERLDRGRDGEPLSGHGKVQRPAGRLQVGDVADADGRRFQGGTQPHGEQIGPGQQASRRSDPGGCGGSHPRDSGPVGPTNGFWADAEWLPCSDGKLRPAQPGIFPLVAGTSRRLVRGGDPGVAVDADASPEARAMRIRGYGNGIVAPAAEEVIRAYMETRGIGA